MAYRDTWNAIPSGSAVHMHATALVLGIAPR